jgi:ribosomal protein S18 acetylase RimI-like enzyme
MIIYKQAETPDELREILELQKANLPKVLTNEEISSQGFVTVNHTAQQIKTFNDIEKHIVAKDGDKTIAYLLAMTKNSKHEIPILVPMFELFERIHFAGKPVSEGNYIVVGQACIKKEYRGQGILDECYRFYRECFEGKYDFAVTEIADDNQRSLNAHKRIGFEIINEYIDPNGTKWHVVVWDWKKALN